MQAQIDLVKEEFFRLVQKILIPKIAEECKQEFGDLLYLKERLDDINNSDENPNEAIRKERCIQQIELNKDYEEGKNLFEYCPAFHEQIQQFFEKLPESLEAIQERERYQIKKSDRFFIKFLKVFKILKWRIGGVKYLFSKKKNTFKTHEVPLQNISKFYLLGEFISEIKYCRRTIYTPIISAYKSLKLNIENKETFSDEGINQGIDKMTEIVTEASENIFEKFEEACQKVNTVELKDKRFEEEKINNKIEKANQVWKKEDKEWTNTFQTFIDGWKNEEEITWLVLKAKERLADALATQDEKLNTTFFDELVSIRTFLDEKTQLLEELKDNEKLSSTIKKSNYEALKKIDREIIPKLVEEISNAKVINLINKLEVELSNDLKNLSTERRVPSIKTDYLSPISESDITSISPYEIINFEILPKLEKSLTDVKSELENGVKDQLGFTKSLGRMIIFGFNSVTEFLSENPESYDESKQMLLESLERSKNRLMELDKQLNETLDISQEKSKQVVETYIKQLHQLADGESAKELRVRIIKAKALKQTEEYKKNVEDSAQNIFSKVKKVTLKQYEVAQEKINLIKEKLDLTEAKEEVKKESTSFLITSMEKINKLPLIYRNTYKMEALNEMELFVGRNLEYERLSESYKNWKDKAKKGALAITGEKWSGTSTFINYAIKKSTFDHALTRIDLTENISTKPQLWTHFQEILQDNSLDDKHKIITNLNDGVKRVIIIENIQRLYLRKVDGFEVLEDLLDILSRTNMNIYWIISSTQFSWEYLKSTMGIADYVKDIIQLAKFRKEELTEAMEKRNQISGYKIHFEPSEEQKKSFSKVPEEELPEKLRSSFFDEMIQFSGGNISLAQTYWLISTSKVDEDKIVIQKPNAPNYSFLNALDNQKFNLLNMLIIHGGLKEHELVETLNYSNATILSTLTSLEESGIIRKNTADRYTINPLIYTKVNQLLKQKNYL